MWQIFVDKLFYNQTDKHTQDKKKQQNVPSVHIGKTWLIPTCTWMTLISGNILASFSPTPAADWFPDSLASGLDVCVVDCNPVVGLRVRLNVCRFESLDGTETVVTQEWLGFA